MKRNRGNPSRSLVGSLTDSTADRVPCLAPALLRVLASLVPALLLVLASLVPAPLQAQSGPFSGSRGPTVPDRVSGGALSVLEATIPELQAAMDRGALSSVQLVETYLARIEAYDRAGPELNAILQVNPRAREEATRLDGERAEGRVRGPLHGIPVILKDNYDTFDMPTTAGSVALAGVVPPDDAFQVTKLREAGAIILAKANMHELAMGITTISSLGGQSRNPYDPRRNPGGSSGGTGAAVAAAFGAVGWGSDTCGSIRIPSCFNNLFGLRPTKGLSSIDGIIPLAHTQDVGGPLARSVTDLAVALDATVGPDPADPATRALEGRALPVFLEALDPMALKGMRLGVVSALFGDPPDDEEVDRLVRGAIAEMVQAGADTVTVEIPELDDLVWPSGVINFEAKFDLMEYFAATPEAPVASLREIVDRGLFHIALQGAFERRERVETRDSEEYREALDKREALAGALIKVMDENDLDALVYPSVRRRPALIGEPQSGSNCQVSAGSGFPAMAIPSGFTEDGLPTAMELLGRPFDDARLVAMAYAYEQAVQPWRPPPAAPPLVAGRAPAPVAFDVWMANGDAKERGVLGRFTYDPVLRTLAFDLELRGFDAEEVFAVTLQQSQGDSLGPALHRLLGPEQLGAAGSITLGNRDVQALNEGRLWLVLYSVEGPEGRRRVRLEVPGDGR